MKKILFITNLPTPYRIDFYNELGRFCNLTVIIEAPRSGTLHFNWNDDKINTFKLIYLSSNLLDEKKINRRILKFLSRRKYDYIFISAYHTYTGILSLLILKLKQIPYCFETDGGMVNKNETKLSKYIKLFLISGARHYFSPSAGSDEYLTHYGAKKNSIQHYPFTSLKNKDILSTVLSKEEKLAIRKALNIKEPHMILAVGQFIHRKGFDILMQAASTMDKNIGIYIVGGKPTNEYLQIQKKDNLTQVHFEGFKTKEELATYFKAADLFVHPTREDIWGLVINEAMAYGLPVVTTNKCVAGMELITDRECLIDTDNVEQLRRIMEKLMNNSELRIKISKQNLHKIADYTIEKMAEAHLKIINQDKSLGR